MKAFARPAYLLRDARLEVRLVYTAFLIFVTIGMATVAAFEWIHVGPAPSRVASYYRGGEQHGEMEMSFPKTFRELVETTHFHAFIMGVLYLVLAHLFLATRVPLVVQRFVILLAFAGLAGDLIAPWLIRYVAGGFSYLLVGSWLAEWTGFGALIAVPLGEMWLGGNGAGR